MADKKLTAVKDPYSKAQVLSAIAADTGLSKRDVGAVFDSLTDLIARHLKSRGPGVFTVPGLAKITVSKKPATKARKGINPFTGEPTVFKAKPARRVVKVRPLKALKDLAAE
jgi:nucleoid DNA-binding protein